MDIFNKPKGLAEFIDSLQLAKDEENLLMELLIGSIFGAYYYDFYLDDKIVHPSYAKILNIYHILDGIDYRLSNYEIKDHYRTNETIRKNFCILRSDLIGCIKKALQKREEK